MTPPTAHRIPIGRKLLGIQALLFGVILAIGAFTFVVLERVVEATDRVGTRYAPQSERMAAMQVLMFRISLEARHAMLVTTPEAICGPASCRPSRVKIATSAFEDSERSRTFFIPASTTAIGLLDAANVVATEPGLAPRGRTSAIERPTTVARGAPRTTSALIPLRFVSDPETLKRIPVTISSGSRISVENV